MTSITTKPDSSQPAVETGVHLFDNWFDPIEAGLRDRVRDFIRAMIEGELDMALSRPRYGRPVMRSGRTEKRRARSVPPVTATATGRGRCWEASGKWRSRCRAPG
jgi:hypothetical protein